MPFLSGMREGRTQKKAVAPIGSNGLLRSLLVSRFFSCHRTSPVCQCPRSSEPAKPFDSGARIPPVFSYRRSYTRRLPYQPFKRFIQTEELLNSGASIPMLIAGLTGGSSSSVIPSCFMA